MHVMRLLPNATHGQHHLEPISGIAKNNLQLRIDNGLIFLRKNNIDRGSLWELPVRVALKVGLH